MYKLFYYPQNASWVPHMVLREIGLEHELVLVDRNSEAQKTAEYLALNPTGRIPTLVDGDKVIFESAAICMYICDSHPENKLVPSPSSPERADVFQWLFYLVTTIQPELMLYFYPKKHMGDVALTDRYAQSMTETQEVRVTDMFGLIDKQLSKTTYLAGPNLSTCDFFLFMLSHWASDFRTAPLSFKHLGKHLRALAKRPSVAEACAIEGIDLSAYQ